jgi:NADPH2 dehydrogenase
MKINQSIMLNNTCVKNRVVYPPCVLFHYPPVNGGVGLDRIAFYTQRAADGIGLIILEATAIAADGRLSVNQPGIYEDQHIVNLRQLVSQCHQSNAVVVVQIHHAGLKTPQEVAMDTYGPTADKANSHTLTKDEIYSLIEQFINAAYRCYLAGADGVEIHGAHGYLLNQFANEVVNHREDEFGGSYENRTRMTKLIIEGIKQKTDEHFIIGIRMGGNDPTIDDGIALAKLYQSYGVHYLHVSSGMYGSFPPKPDALSEYGDITCIGARIKAATSIPVIVVNNIRTLEKGDWLIANNYADMVAYGRNILLNEHWYQESLSGKVSKQCLYCQKCVWRTDEHLCPANIKAQGEKL